MKEYIKGAFLFSIVFLLISCDRNVDHETTGADDTIEYSSEETQPNYYNYEQFYNPFGYASIDITNRSSIHHDEQVVENEIEFLNALRDEDVKIIHVVNDLNLGSQEVEQLMELNDLNISDYRSIYRKHNHQPLMHPVLMDSGVGQVRIVSRDNLMIYSETGATLKHVSFLIDDSKNIVFRNLEFAELWEWDELNRGSFKRNDWDYFLIEKSSGIWLDHLTFNQAYDGIVDVKEYSQNITLSWSKLNFKPNAFIQKQIDYLYENREQYSYFNELITLGVSLEDIVMMSSFQKKGFNLGNSTDGNGFESITMTFHHLEIYNLQDRMPRIRKGDAHLYHIHLNNENIHTLTERYDHLGVKFVNQGIIATEMGSVLMEHSIFEFVRSPIKNHQDSRTDEKYSGKYKIVNSEYRSPYRNFFGSSEDLNTIWVHVNDHPLVKFEMRNYNSIPYRYELQDVYFLDEKFTNYPTGHQEIEGLDWLFIDTTLHGKGE